MKDVSQSSLLKMIAPEGISGAQRAAMPVPRGGMFD